MNKRTLITLFFLGFSSISFANKDDSKGCVCDNCPCKHHHIGCQHPPKSKDGKMKASHHHCMSHDKNHEKCKNMKCDCPCAEHTVSNEELEKEIVNLGPGEDEMYRQEFPDYLPGESEVLRMEPGPDLSRTQPFENNPYK